MNKIIYQETMIKNFPVVDRRMQTFILCPKIWSPRQSTTACPAGEKDDWF
jgi:hypothetical protein